MRSIFFSALLIITTSLRVNAESIIPNSSNQILLVQDANKGQLTGKTIQLCDYNPSTKESNNCKGLGYNERSFFTNSDMETLEANLRNYVTASTVSLAAGGAASGAIIGAFFAVLFPPSALIMGAFTIAGAVTTGTTAGYSNHIEGQEVLNQFEEGISKNDLIYVADADFYQFLEILKRQLEML